MKKRFTALLIAIITVVSFAFTGCASTKNLTKEEIIAAYNATIALENWSLEQTTTYDKETTKYVANGIDQGKDTSYLFLSRVLESGNDDRYITGGYEYYTENGEKIKRKTPSTAMTLENMLSVKSVITDDKAEWKEVSANSFKVSITVDGSLLEYTFTSTDGIISKIYAEQKESVTATVSATSTMTISKTPLARKTDFSEYAFKALTVDDMKNALRETVELNNYLIEQIEEYDGRKQTMIINALDMDNPEDSYLHFKGLVNDVIVEEVFRTDGYTYREDTSGKKIKEEGYGFYVPDIKELLTPDLFYSEDAVWTKVDYNVYNFKQTENEYETELTITCTDGMITRIVGSEKNSGNTFNVDLKISTTTLARKTDFSEYKFKVLTVDEMKTALTETGKLNNYFIEETVEYSGIKATNFINALDMNHTTDYYFHTKGITDGDDVSDIFQTSGYRYYEDHNGKKIKEAEEFSSIYGIKDILLTDLFFSEDAVWTNIEHNAYNFKLAGNGYETELTITCTDGMITRIVGSEKNSGNTFNVDLKISTTTLARKTDFSEYSLAD